MMPPTSIDGTDITGATIDGTDVQEITVDGDTVFTAAPDLPNSAIHQWRFDEGSGSTAADSIGTNDGTISGATWTSVSDLVGGFGLSFDQTDDEVDFSTVSAVNSGLGHAVAITINLDNQNTQVIWAQTTGGGSDRVMILVDSNNLQAGYFDGSSFNAREQTGGVTTSRARILLNIDGPNDTVQIWQDAIQVDDNDPGALAPTRGTNGHKVGVNTLGEEPMGGVSDNLIIYDSFLTPSEIQTDYDAQPWS
jgi:hypothetical protein